MELQTIVGHPCPVLPHRAIDGKLRWSPRVEEVHPTTNQSDCQNNLSTKKRESMTLYHISDKPGIRLFEPRPAPARSGVEGDMVWAIDREHLPNYLLPRDCPRVTFCKRVESRPEDVERLIGSTEAERVIAVESGWIDRILSEKIVLYEFDSSSFELEDENAGYWISYKAVSPRSERLITSPLLVLLKENVELRFMPSLWRLREDVADSTLEFSIIRMGNAVPPPKEFVSKYPVP